MSLLNLSLFTIEIKLSSAYLKIINYSPLSRSQMGRNSATNADRCKPEMMPREVKMMRSTSLTKKFWLNVCRKNKMLTVCGGIGCNTIKQKVETEVGRSI